VDIAAAIIRRGDEMLMVLQAGPGEEPFWSVPGGRIEPGELATEGLVREVREETGITVIDPGRLAFVLQQDERREGYFATIWVFDVARFGGEIAVDDPDGFVREAAWLRFDEATEHLERIAWQPLTVRYLRGALEPGSAWLRRMYPDGSEELTGPL
jgi:8-oxo-dGTP diphosphatase